MEREMFKLMDGARTEALEKKRLELEENLKEKLRDLRPVGTPEMQQEAREAEEKRLRAKMKEEEAAHNKALEAAIFENYEGSRRVALNLVREAEYKAFQKAKGEEMLKNEYAVDPYDGPPLSVDYNREANPSIETLLSNDFNHASDGPDA